MAFMIPETVKANSTHSTPGERRVFERLRTGLPDEYLVYYNIPVHGRYPDFIIVAPDLGVVVLEVKDWRLDSLLTVASDHVDVRDKDGERRVKNPVQQTREYVLLIVDLLKRRPLLFDGERLCVNWEYGAVFPNINRAQFEHPDLFGRNLHEVPGWDGLILQEDLAKGSVHEALRKLFPAWVPKTNHVNQIQIDEIRSTLYPEIRIAWSRSDDEIVQIMDREQERLARSLREGHYLVRGVAGSGKTITLVARVRYLRACHPEWRILVVCYNRVLGNALRNVIDPDERVEVMHFHSWCRRALERAKMTIPEPPASGQANRTYWDRDIPQLLLKAFEEKRIQRGRYHAILVDEGQDFADDWYRPLLEALDPQTNSLFIALDSSQTIYKRKVSWRKIGIQIKGHTKILRVNYRNTRPILSTAYALIRDLDEAANQTYEASGDFVVPDRALRDGPKPEILRFRSLQEEWRHAIQWIRECLNSNMPAENILVLGLNRFDMVSFERRLHDSGIPGQLLGASVPGLVRLSTIHSAKGLDAECVLVLNVNALQNLEDGQARRLLYIAMTRARTKLCLSYSGEAPLLARLQRNGERSQKVKTSRRFENQGK